MDKLRGGQAGNTNAMKHGFYSRRFTSGECDDLEQVGETLESEIALLRVSIRHLADMGLRVEDAAEMRRIVDCVGLATVRVGLLLKMQYVLTGRLEGGDELQRIVGDVLMEMSEELKGL